METMLAAPAAEDAPAAERVGCDACVGRAGSLLSGPLDLLDPSAAVPSAHEATAAAPTTRDYPVPPALTSRQELLWDEDRAPVDNYQALGSMLAAAGDLYRRPSYGGGLLLGSTERTVEPRVIASGKQLSAVIVDRVRVRVLKAGKSKGGKVPSGHLDTMLASEAFLQAFRPVDAVVRAPQYLPDFSLTRCGYNDGGPGQRVLYVGGEPAVADSTGAIDAFLAVMDFASISDRTNAVAAALTVLLRNHWPGAKPVAVVTATKSHAGKDTVILFASGTARQVSISYQATDWALERSFVGALKNDPTTGVVVVENARLSKGAKVIASAFVERFVTDPEPLLFSTGSGSPVRRRNNVVTAISTNYGTVSEDIMNRALPIHLAPEGNVADRRSPIGNPKLSRFRFGPRTGVGG